MNHRRRSSVEWFKHIIDEADVPTCMLAGNVQATETSDGSLEKGVLLTNKDPPMYQPLDSSSSSEASQQFSAFWTTNLNVNFISFFPPKVAQPSPFPSVPQRPPSEWPYAYQNPLVKEESYIPNQPNQSVSSMIHAAPTFGGNPIFNPTGPRFYPHPGATHALQPAMPRPYSHIGAPTLSTYPPTRMTPVPQTQHYVIRPQPEEEFDILSYLEKNLNPVRPSIPQHSAAGAAISEDPKSDRTQAMKRKKNREAARRSRAKIQQKVRLFTQMKDQMEKEQGDLLNQISTINQRVQIANSILAMHHCEILRSKQNSLRDISLEDLIPMQ